MKTLIGRVVSNKMDKTVIVLVKILIRNSFYGKNYYRFKRYPVHDEYNLCLENDIVEICHTRPISKTKFWKVIRFIN